MSYEIQSIKELPSIEDIKKISQSLAILDLIIVQEWEFRYFSFNSKWDSDEMIASMRNGEGDEYFILFSKIGMVGKIYSIDEGQVPKKDIILQMIPNEFNSFKTEPAFKLENMTCCVWKKYSDNVCSVSPVMKKIPLLKFIVENEKYYHIWAEEYFGTSIDVNKIKAIFNHVPLNNHLINDLNKKITLQDIEEDVKEIGYPIGMRDIRAERS